MLCGYSPLPLLARPAHRFMCCLSLGFGVKLILWPHLCICLYSVAVAIERVLAGNGAFDAWQIFEVVWSMLGIPILAAGLWGVYHRLEPHVHLYLDYLTISVLIDMYQIVDLLLMKDSCVHVKLAAGTQGKAFACGVARSISMTTAAVFIAFSLYMVYIVWSWCEEMEGTAASWALADLLAAADGKRPASVTEGLRRQAIDEFEELESGMASVASGASLVYGAISTRVANNARLAQNFVDKRLGNLESLAS